MAYSSKVIYLMKTIQRSLRRDFGIQISLQDPLVIEKLLQQAEYSGSEKLMDLARQIKLELGSETETPKVKDHNATVVDSSRYKLRSNQDDLVEGLTTLLADYCGPISHFLVEQVLSDNEDLDIHNDFDFIVEQLSAEIGDFDDQKNFIRRSRELK